MRNIIIGLGAALALSAELVACDAAVVVQLDNPRSLAPAATALILTDSLPSFDQDFDIGSKKSDFYKNIFKNDVFTATFDIGALLTQEITLDIFNISKYVTSSVAPTFELKPLIPPLLDIKWDTLIRPFNFGGAAVTHLLVVQPKKTCPTVATSKRRAYRYYNATVGKEKRKAKKLTKLPRHDRVRGREAKFAARDFGNDAD